MLQAELRVTSGKQSGHVIPLVNSRFLIGREEDCHLRPNSDLVSRHHCVFKLDEYSLRVRDLGSTNGTFVNGERLRGEVMLNTGDRVAVGKLEFEVAIGDAITHGISKEAAAKVAPTSSADPTDSFELGDTPATPTPTLEFRALESDSAVSEPVSDAPTSAQETVALQGDTVFAGAPQPPMPTGYPQQPIGYSMPYPQQPYPYGQPYGMPMMGYPPMPPMPYPQMGQMGMYPQHPMPAPPAPPPAPEVEAETPVPTAGRVGAVDVRLPDPSETGAKPPEPKPEATSTKKSDSDATRDSAAEIIKQYTQRRPKV